jgi:hypothetical protein
MDRFFSFLSAQINYTVVYRTFAHAACSVAHKYENHILVGLILHALAAC